MPESADDPKCQSSQRLTIALACDWFYPNVGGVESHIYQLAQCLLVRGHRVVVITHAYGSNWDRQGVRYMARGLKVYYIPARPFYKQCIFMTVFGLLPVVREIYIRESVDLVHGHAAFSSLSMECLMHATLMGLQTVFTDHSIFGFADLSAILANKSLVMSLNVIRGFICVSHVAKENTVLRAGMAPERVFVIPNAIDPASFMPDPSKRDPDNGGDGPKRLVLEEMIEHNNLHSRIQMLGEVTHGQVHDALVKGDIFLNTSLTESFCIAIVEAASCGLKVVSTAVGGIPEVLPPHMLHLAPCSASGLANVVASAVEDVLAERELWFKELHAVGKYENGTSDISHTSLKWPPTSAVDAAWAQHNEVRQFYNWNDVAARTEFVYQMAMTQTRSSAQEAIKAAWERIGPIAGKILAIAWVIEWMLFLLLEWIRPAKSIERTPYLCTTQANRQYWRHRKGSHQSPLAVDEAKTRHAELH